MNKWKIEYYCPDEKQTSEVEVFFDQLTVESLISAIKKLEKIKIREEDCIRNARRFSKERFKSEILKFVKTHARITRS